jgi:EAL domain-containing protein (putative c-di-GMP-specific phosphodiesterase class I)
MEDMSAANIMLLTLRSKNIRIYLDDFGTGFSSLSYLLHFPVDTIKIDKSFVNDVTTDPDDQAITQAIISMAHSLKLDVVAEGVETREQLEILRSQGCDIMQGYLFSKPIPVDDIAPFLLSDAAQKILS